jgi:hypothetical protein
MKNTFASLVLALFLFPSIAMGETVKWDDLVEMDGLYYKKFTEVPFTGKTTGKIQGSFKNGKTHGPWVGFHQNENVNEKLAGTFKNGVRVSD